MEKWMVLFKFHKMMERKCFNFNANTMCICVKNEDIFVMARLLIRLVQKSWCCEIYLKASRQIQH